MTVTAQRKLQVMMKQLRHFRQMYQRRACLAGRGVTVEELVNLEKTIATLQEIVDDYKRAVEEKS